MKRWLYIFAAFLLLFILAGGYRFAQRRAKPWAETSAKAENVQPQQISASQKQTAPSAVNLKADVSQNKTAQTAVFRRQGDEAFRVTLLSAVPGRTRFRFELGEYTVEEESVDGKTYSRVQLDGAWPSMVKGRPALPVIRRDFVVAKGRKGASTRSGYTKDVFEPDDEYKGDFARSYFYMATCYNDEIANWTQGNLGGTRYPVFTDWTLQMLLEWHRLDPVSQKEITRNNKNKYFD